MSSSDESVTNHPAPATPDELHHWLTRNMKLTLPRRAILAGHQSPFDFLAHAFLAPAGHSTHAGSADAVLWAARGGGKTYLGALLVFLDMVFRPKINVRILSGSLEQATRMFTYLRQFLATASMDDLVQGKIRAHALTLRNGSHLEVMAQSETSIRGTRVQRIVCDEVDLFTPELFDAAQLVTRSMMCGTQPIQGSVICLSTMHRAQGTMARLVADCSNGTRSLFKWSVIDALERCPESRACSESHPNPHAGAIPLPVLDPLPADACPLHNECQGRAKHLPPGESGHHYIADAISLKSRVSQDTWKTEMLCQGISRADAVYHSFNPKKHVTDHVGIEAQFRRGWSGPRNPNLSLVCGMDFGLRHPTVVLWGILDETPGQPSVLYIVDELRTIGQTTEVNAQRIARGETDHTTPHTLWAKPRVVAIDPSGAAKRSNSKKSDADRLVAAGLEFIPADNAVERGVSEVLARISPAQGEPRLFVHSRCEVLISDLLMYHYALHLPHSRTPVKDGPDHGCDALRYLVMEMESRSGATSCNSYTAF